MKRITKRKTLMLIAILSTIMSSFVILITVGNILFIFGWGLFPYWTPIASTIVVFGSFILSFSLKYIKHKYLKVFFSIHIIANFLLFFVNIMSICSVQLI
ncbi:hypothetical protein SD1155_03425 [Sulfitobacter donghicola]|nr:hypothetical protein SD1155_03425 [Sulfitobacter donghicola]